MCVGWNQSKEENKWKRKRKNESGENGRGKIGITLCLLKMAKLECEKKVKISKICFQIT